MSEAQSENTSAPEPKKRSSAEKAIVWTLILVGMAAAGLEYSARQSYDLAIQKLDSELDRVEEAGQQLSMADIRANVLSGLYSETNDSSDGSDDQILVKWWSLKGYRMRLGVTKTNDQFLTMYTTFDTEGNESTSNVRMPFDQSNLPPGDDSGGMMGGFGGGGPGGSGRPGRPGGVAEPVGVDGSGGPGGGFGGPGGGFGGGRGGGRGGRGGRMFSQGLAGELAQEGVRESLGLSEDENSRLDSALEGVRRGAMQMFQQMQGMSDDERREAFAMMQMQTETALSQVLTPDQMEMLRSSMIKRQGIDAFTREDILGKLGLEGEQLKKAVELGVEMQAKRRGRMQELGRDAEPDVREAAMKELRDGFRQGLLELLNEEQQERLNGLLGAE